jgi:hypothetical protein
MIFYRLSPLPPPPPRLENHIPATTTRFGKRMEQLTTVEMDLLLLVSIHLVFRNALSFGTKRTYRMSSGDKVAIEVVVR